MDARQDPEKHLTHIISEKEHRYVSWLYHTMDKRDIPDDEVFEQKKQLSLNVRDKFMLLKDVKPDSFCDVIVQLVREPYDLGDKITLWVTDYTENDFFFRHLLDWDAQPENGGFLGHTTGVSQGTGRKWDGPLGKRSMQMTCYEPHATTIRQLDLQKGDWARFNNIHLKFGHNNANLEGFLREDRDSNRTKLHVIPYNARIDAETNSSLKEAIRRNRDYEREARKRQKNSSTDLKPENDIKPLETAGKKRQADDQETNEQQPTKKKNSRQKRQERRAAAAAAAAQKEKEEQARIELNPDVRCEHMSEPVTGLGTILEPVLYSTIIGGEKVAIQLPFTNAKYRTIGRVVDFHPPHIKKFARKVTQQRTDFDCLSDNSESEESDSDEETPNRTLLMGSSNFENGIAYEWNFALQVEELNLSVKDNTKAVQKKLWVAVNNHAGQCLLGMNAEEVWEGNGMDRLRSKLGILWGDLEENKAADEAVKTRREASLHHQPLHSDELEDPMNASDKDILVDLGARTKNLPFSFCMTQHGVQVSEKDPRKADAGDGKRWEAVFMLFGVKISG